MINIDNLKVLAHFFFKGEESKNKIRVIL